MRALCFDGDAATVCDRPKPELRPGYALVRTLLAGVCNTDLEIARGYMGFEGILGHEFVGRVEAGPARWVGKRVVAEINFACGQCEQCQRQLGRHCPDRSVLGILKQDGAFAEHVLVPIGNLHEVPDALSHAEAVFCEPLAAAYEILEQVPIAPGVETVVLGDGKLGLLIAQVLDRAGARVLAVGKHQRHLDLLADRGIGTVLLDNWDRTPRDVVVEATGTAAGFEMAMAATRPRGMLVLKSTVADAQPLQLAPLVINEIALIGSRCGPFAPALAALQDGAIQVREMVDATLPLEEGVAALEQARATGVLKVLLQV